MLQRGLFAKGILGWAATALEEDLRTPEGCTELAPQGIAPLTSRKLWAAGTGANTAHGCSRRSLGKEHAAFRL